MKKNDKALEKAIEQSYYKQARGMQIDIMKIGALFKGAKDRIQDGEPVDSAVKAMIDLHCERVG